ncbi:MAG: peptidoglycan DD-metalloendopeptidase family protein [Bacteroidia bacterium]
MKKNITCGLLLAVSFACLGQKDTAKQKDSKIDYDKSISKADLAFSGSDYLTAKRFYKLALMAKPGETYPKEHIDMCDKKMASNSWMSTDLNCPCHKGKITPSPDNSGSYTISSDDSISYAVLPGSVSSVIKDTIRHLFTVMVKHGKYIAMYSSLTRASVKQGDEINEGDTIGFVHKSGESYILNFTLMQGKKSEDATKYLRCK